MSLANSVYKSINKKNSKVYFRYLLESSAYTKKMDPTRTNDKNVSAVTDGKIVSSNRSLISYLASFAC